MKLAPLDDKVQGFNVELRTEIVALLSADCDLVDRTPPKRKGVLVSPLRSVPKNIAKDPEKMEVLKAPTVQAQGDKKIPANLFYFELTDVEGTGPVGDKVIFLETIASVGFGDLKTSTKLAELSDVKRQDLQERIKFHFTRPDDG